MHNSRRPTKISAATINYLTILMPHVVLLKSYGQDPTYFPLKGRVKLGELTSKFYIYGNKQAQEQEQTKPQLVTENY
jgi:hypothetical protein